MVKIRGFLEKIRSILHNINDNPRLTSPLYKKTLVISPHPDDETIGCGGTILLNTANGNKVVVLVLTDGSGGNPQKKYRDIKIQRKKEAMQSFKKLGVYKHYFLERKDGQLNPDEETVTEVCGIIHSEKPQAILCPWPGETHPDHKASYAIVVKALEEAGIQMDIYLYEIWDALNPNTYVDVTGVIEEKISAIKCYESQLHYFDFVQTTRGLNRYRSLTKLYGRGYCEAFIKIKPKDLTGV